jgi:hypothetical protein
VIFGDYRIGTFALKADGSLGGLIRAFGRPSGRWHDGYGCRTRWRSLGLQVALYNVKGADACTETGGRFGYAEVTGTNWKTSKGLAIGDSAARANELFPKARYYPVGKKHVWLWLIHRHVYPIGRRIYRGHDYSGLAAKIVGGRVVALRVQYPGGGL